MIAPGEIEYRDVPEPTPEPGEVLLRIRRIGVCGSDVHVRHGQHPFTGYPVVQGHEFSAVVEAVGDGVDDIAVGRLVTATPQLVCGECAPCRRGDYNICDELRVKGFQAPGVAQDLFVTAADAVVLLPDSFTADQGAAIEPVAVAVHATARAGDMAGRNVVVAGAGPIGNLVAQCAAARGAKALISDVSEFRLEIARRCGIEHTVNVREESLADGVRRVFGEAGYSIGLECAGVEGAMDDIIQTVAKGGRIMTVGVFAGKPQVDLSVVGDRELSLVGTLMYRKDDYEQAVEWVAAGAVAVNPLFTTHFPFEQYREAYDYIDREGERSLKVLIDL